MSIKLSAKFARQENEEARLARIARRRIPADRIETVRRLLELPQSERQIKQHKDRTKTLFCPDCHRAFTIPMHLGRHQKVARHGSTA